MLCLCHYIPTMSLCCFFHNEDTKHRCEFFFFNLRDLAVKSFFRQCELGLTVTTTEEICYSTIKTFCYRKKCLPWYGLFIDKTCVSDFLSGNPQNTDTPIIRTFWRVPLLSVLTRFHCNKVDQNPQNRTHRHDLLNLFFFLTTCIQILQKFRKE